MSEHHHAHPFYEIMVVVRGESFLLIDDQVYQCLPGMAAVFRPGQAHINRYRSGEDGLKHIWVSFVAPEQAFIQVVDVCRGQMRRLHAGRGLMSVSTLSRILRDIEALASNDSPRARLRFQLLVHAFYAELINELLTIADHPFDSIDREVMIRHKVAMVSEHIASGLYFNATLDALAQWVGYSPSHFARVYKRVTGHTVHQHINQCRIDRVKAMLAQNMPYKAMAVELGFADKTSLSRWINKFRHAIED